MQFNGKPRMHFRPAKGWINDPNGLVCFGGYYHAFYQHAPNYEKPFIEPMTWGHARTKDFINWEELPVVLWADEPYDAGGCWSGTAAVKDGKLYLYYASVIKNEDGSFAQSVSVAFSEDGEHFTKYEGNPIIPHYPPEGSNDFRDPAVMVDHDGTAYIVMATGAEDRKHARLLLYKSTDMLHFDYAGILFEYENMVYCECPSFMPYGNDGEYLLAASVCGEGGTHTFSVMVGAFDGKTFTPRVSSKIWHGPDQYAGQVFRDDKGRCLLITWIAGWHLSKCCEISPGVLSVPAEIFELDGTLAARPVDECRHLYAASDPAVQRTDDGFTVPRDVLEPLHVTCSDVPLLILHDAYIVEIYADGGKNVYTVLLPEKEG